MVFLFDLDNTLCYTVKKNEKWAYLEAIPIKERIEKVNELYDNGNIIIIETARGCVSDKDWYEETKNQLISWGLKFNILRTGVKFNCDFIIDDKAINSEDFFK